MLPRLQRLGAGACLATRAASSPGRHGYLGAQECPERPFRPYRRLDVISASVRSSLTPPGKTYYAAPGAPGTTGLSTSSRREPGIHPRFCTDRGWIVDAGHRASVGGACASAAGQSHGSGPSSRLRRAAAFAEQPPQADFDDPAPWRPIAGTPTGASDDPAPCVAEWQDQKSRASVDRAATGGTSRPTIPQRSKCQSRQSRPARARPRPPGPRPARANWSGGATGRLDHHRVGVLVVEALLRGTVRRRVQQGQEPDERHEL
jgi:hypothetical protein